MAYLFFFQAMLQMMNVDSVMPQLTSILHEASLPRDPNHYKTGFWGRAQVYYLLSVFLLSCSIDIYSVFIFLAMAF